MSLDGESVGAVEIGPLDVADVDFLALRNC